MNVKAFTWPAMIIGMLIVNVAIVGVTIVAAHKGGGASVSPAYDERALHWDDYRRQMAQSNALGWSCLAQLTRPTRDARTGTLAITLTSGEERPIEAAGLEVQIFHSGHPAEPTSLKLLTDAAGKTVTSVPASRSGYYTLHIESPAAAGRAGYVYDVEILATEPDAAEGLTHP